MVGVVAGFLALSMVAEAGTLTFRVRVPGATPRNDTVYLTGGFQGWVPNDPSMAMEHVEPGVWEKTLNVPDGIGIEYSFTRGSWESVETGPSGGEVAPHQHITFGDATLEREVDNWADVPLSTVSGRVEWFESAGFLNGRRVWVYLPPGYAETTSRYPVLYMHDGQNLFDAATSAAGEWGVDEACEALISAGEIEPIIVVGIESSSARCWEYTAWDEDILPCTGGGADWYLTEIRDELMPEVNSRYRTRVGSHNAFMAGSSLGGFVSVYAGYGYSEVWGRVAGLSPSYWAQPDLFAMASGGGRPVLLERLYQDLGTNESGQTNFRTMRDIAMDQGFVLGEDLESLEAAGHSHNEYYWGQRMPDVLRFLVSPPVTCSGDVDGDNDTDVFDFNAFASRFGDQGVERWTSGDLDGDGDVDALDFNVFATDFGCPE